MNRGEGWVAVPDAAVIRSIVHGVLYLVAFRR
jgi:hypothetical protein